MSAELPNLKDLASTLTALMGRPVTVAKVTAPYKPAPTEPVLIAVYRSPEGAPVALGLVDLPFAASSGAALAMFPMGRAEECIKAKKLDEQLQENFHEVMNVISTNLSTEHSRTRLDQVVTGLKSAPTDAAAILTKPRVRLDLEGNISGYSKGKLAFLLA